MEFVSLIIDNFLDDPDSVRELALGLDFVIEGTFPGKRALKKDKEYENYIQNKIESVLKVKISEWSSDSFSFQLCLDGDETWIHKDSEWALILYLNPNPVIESGTGLFKEIQKDVHELDIEIGNVYNRMVIYRGTIPHRSMLPGFGDCKENGRLTQVFSFKTKE